WESLRSPYLPLPPPGAGPDALLSGLDPKFRSNLRRRRRKLSAKGPLTLRRVERAEAEALSAFYSLERAGWKGTAGTAIACDAETRRFYDEVALAAERGGYLALYLLCAGETPAAIQFGLQYRNRYYLPKTTYAEDLKDCSPGHLLME